MVLCGVYGIVFTLIETCGALQGYLPSIYLRNINYITHTREGNDTKMDANVSQIPLNHDNSYLNGHPRGKWEGGTEMVKHVIIDWTNIVRGQQSLAEPTTGQLESHDRSSSGLQK